MNNSNLSDLSLRPLHAADVAAIASWPVYPPEFTDLDYALRAQGWLAEHLHQPDTWVFAAHQADELIAFTMMAKTSEREAEFRIALRADKIGQGLGRLITGMTLAKGFTQLGLSRVHLIVRKNNPRAIHLYQRLGFVARAACWKEINGKRVHFLEMDLLKQHYHH
ncbi:MAG: GNAT family N-acetyltransferase [Gammaproteobacteria bacterium]|nr:GNAT family N-acetyltransferase [Gammaproteobacteria bacterium]